MKIYFNANNKAHLEALEACGEDGPCIKQHLYDTQGYEGASGIKSFDENGDIKDPYYALKTVKDGKFVKYE